MSFELWIKRSEQKTNLFDEFPGNLKHILNVHCSSFALSRLIDNTDYWLLQLLLAHKKRLALLPMCSWHATKQSNLLFLVHRTQVPIEIPDKLPRVANITVNDNVHTWDWFHDIVASSAHMRVFHLSYYSFGANSFEMEKTRI